MTFVPYPTANFTSFMDLFTYSNTVTSDLFGMTFVIGLFMVTFIGMKGYGTEKALLASATLTWVLATIGWVAGFLPVGAVIPLFLFTVIMIYFVGKD